MKQLIDFDGLFDEKLAEYIGLNEGKYTAEQWERRIPKLYQKFGDTYIPRVKNTPKGYYAEMSDEELAETLARHIGEGVPVSDFLCRELEKRPHAALIPFIGANDPELATTAINLVGPDPEAYGAYFAVLGREDADENAVEAICEQIKLNADPARERLLSCYRAGIRTELMLEMMARCKEKSDEVFEILLTAFRTSAEEMPMRASYLASYGDPRALDDLLSVIARDDVNFLEFQELRYAIEALGGEYNEVRDFSSDPYYQEILSQQTMPPSDGKPDA